MENYKVLLEYNDMVLPPLVFIVDSTMNIISLIHYECERRAHHFTIL